LDFASENPEEAYRIMAEREGITAKEFAEALRGMHILNKQDQPAILGSRKLKANLERVCETLNRAGEIDFNCTNIHTKVNASL
jgi:NitT/TauT family transport system substrate-binding protein